MSRWLGRLTALAATMILLAGTGAGGLPARAGTRAESARAPFGDYVDRLSFEVTSVDPAVVTAMVAPVVVAGLGAAVVALVLRAPFLVVVVVAAGTAALLRLA